MKIKQTLAIILGISIIISAFAGSTLATDRVETQSTQLGLHAPTIIGELLSFNASTYIAEKTQSQKLPPVIIGDGKLSPIWEEVKTFTVASYGENGLIASVHSNNFVYFLIQFDLTMDWVAIQLDSDNSSDPENFDPATMEPMAAGDDMWVFGTTSIGVFGDANSHGQAPPFVTPDDQDDLFWEEIIINDTSGAQIAKAIEVGRALDTGDTAGRDAVFTTSYNVSMYFASNEFHRPDSNIAYAKFVLSGLEIGGNTTDTGGDTDVKPQEDNKISATVYMFYNGAMALLVGSIVYAVVTIIGVYEIKKEVRRSDELH